MQPRELHKQTQHTHGCEFRSQLQHTLSSKYCTFPHSSCTLEAHTSSYKLTQAHTAHTHPLSLEPHHSAAATLVTRCNSYRCSSRTDAAAAIAAAAAAAAAALPFCPSSTLRAWAMLACLCCTDRSCADSHSRQQQQQGQGSDQGSKTGVKSLKLSQPTVSLLCEWHVPRSGQS